MKEVIENYQFGQCDHKLVSEELKIMKNIALLKERRKIQDFVLEIFDEAVLVVGF